MQSALAGEAALVVIMVVDYPHLAPEKFGRVIHKVNTQIHDHDRRWTTLVRLLEEAIKQALHAPPPEWVKRNASPDGYRLTRSEWAEVLAPVPQVLSGMDIPVAARSHTLRRSRPISRAVSPDVALVEDVLRLVPRFLRFSRA